MELTIEDAKRLAVSFGGYAVGQIKDTDARNEARDTLARLRGEKKQSLADARANYWLSERDNAARELLKTVYWPLVRRARTALSHANARVTVLDRAMASRFAHVPFDSEDFELNATSEIASYAIGADAPTIAHLYLDRLFDVQRLTVAVNNCVTAAERVGRVPLSPAWLKSDHSPLIGTAANRRFLFRGGRDVITDSQDHADILQDAFLHAIEEGDCNADKVPFTGSIYRHIQYARAHATRVAGAEWRGIRDALIGVKGVERAYPDYDDKHVMRRLGTKNHGTIDTHRAALKDERDDLERRTVNVYVAAEARKDSLAVAERASQMPFAGIVADLLLRGATIAQISELMGITEGTILKKVFATNDQIRPSGMDFETLDENAEHDYAIAKSEEAEAARLRNLHNLRQRADYIRNARARALKAA